MGESQSLVFQKDHAERFPCDFPPRPGVTILRGSYSWGVDVSVLLARRGSLTACGDSRADTRAWCADSATASIQIAFSKNAFILKRRAKWLPLRPNTNMLSALDTIGISPPSVAGA